MNNRFTLFLICFLLSSAFCGGQEKVFILSFDIPEWDFGVAKEDGGVLMHEYAFVNTGKEPVTIAEVATYCRCTTAEFPRTPVASGERGVIKVLFDPYGYQGEVSRGVTVITDDGQKGRLSFKVSLIPRVKPVEEEYPVLVAPGLRIAKTELNYSLLRAGESKSVALRVANVSEEALSLSLTCGDDGMKRRLSFNCPKTLAPGEKADIAIQCGPSADVGIFCDTLTLAVGKASFWKSLLSSRTEVPVVVKATLAEKFDDALSGDAAPSAYVGSSYYNFGKLEASSAPVKTTYTLYNKGQSTLYVRDMDCPPGISSSLVPGTSVAPGGNVSFTITLDPKSFASGSVFVTARILFNDPANPFRDLMFAAKIL